MKFKTKGGAEYNVSLKTTFAEYNCSTKMVGRPKIRVEQGGKEVDGWAYANKDATDIAHFVLNNKKPLIQEWLASLNHRETFNVLKSSSPFFANDGGTYLPSVLLYSDNIQVFKQQNWYDNFKCIIEEFQKDSSYGVRVEESSIFQNYYYRGSPHPAKVWIIFPPHMAEYIFSDENKGTKLKLLVPGRDSDYYSKEDYVRMTRLAS